MKKLIIILLIFVSTELFANINAIVSIAPQKYFLSQIGKDKVNITVMVKPGNSPHTYEPKPSQMKDITKADIYFAIGVEFENSWLNKFSNQNKDMKIVDLSLHIVRYNTKDPHIWTSPANVKIIAKNILESLISLDKQNKSYYQQNYKSFISYIDKVDSSIKTILKDIPKNSKFMVFHPSWGYFAKQYSLVQLPIQIQGKAPKPREIIHLIKVAKKQKVQAIFTQPEFSTKVAKTIATQLDIKVIQTSPLSINWGENLIKLAKAIANKK